MTDLFYLWGNFDADLEPTERALGTRMRNHWIHFAHHHRPAGTEWPAYGGREQRRFLSFDSPLVRNVSTDSVHSEWKRTQCDAIDRLRQLAAA